MKADDRHLTLLTGLVLTVVVGMLAQNSTAIMNAFTGKASLIPGDDAYTVRAGKPQAIDVLLNDHVADDFDVAAIRIIQAPACGTLSPFGRQLEFAGSEACSGPVTFTYCLSESEDCAVATVSLNVRNPVAPAPASSAATVAAAAPELAAPAPVAEVDPQVATAELQALGEPSTPSAVPSGTEQGLAGISQPFQPDPAPEIVGAILPDSIETASNGKDDGIADSQPAVAPIIVAVAELGTPQTSPVPDAAPSIDQSACQVEFSAVPARAASIAVEVSAPCLPATAMIVRQGELVFGVQTDAGGVWRATIPALSETALVEIELPDGIFKSAEVRVPDADRFSRVAMVWTGEVELDLHASEFGAARGGPGYVWPGQPGSYRQSRQTGGGWLESFGSQDAFAEIYTLPASSRSGSGVIDLSLHVADGTTVCDKAVDLRILRLHNGASKRSSVRFDLPACGESLDGYEVVNALDDLRVAAR